MFMPEAAELLNCSKLPLRLTSHEKKFKNHDGIFFFRGFLMAKFSGNIPENFSVMVSLNAVSYGKGENFWFFENAPE
jgi:hypothetical protein